jgi:hypothetical protein
LKPTKISYLLTRRKVMGKKGKIRLLSFTLLFSIILTGCNASLTAPVKATSEPTTGSITGKILSADGKPLVDVMRGEIGYIILICPDNSNSRGECVSKVDLKKGGSEIVASICGTLEMSSNCKLHLMLGATEVTANGSYIFPAVFPGKYELLLIIISNGIAVSIELINVDPVQAGNTVEYNFTSK